jgi:serine protease Do
MPKNVEANANDHGNQQQQNNGNVDLGKRGLTLAPANSVAGAGNEGVVVTDVDSSGVAAQKGFATGDVILQVAGKSVSTPAQVREALASVRSQGKKHFVMVQVKKGNNKEFLTLPVGKG